jgi:hypothetical protein
MRVVQMALDEIVDMIAVRDLRVATIRAMDVPRFMATALMVGCACIGVRCGDFKHALIDVVAMGMMQVAIVHVINVSVVLDCHMAATGAVLMFVAFHLGANSHVIYSFSKTCSDGVNNRHEIVWRLTALSKSGGSVDRSRARQQDLNSPYCRLVAVSSASTGCWVDVGWRCVHSSILVWLSLAKDHRNGQKARHCERFAVIWTTGGPFNCR